MKKILCLCEEGEARSLAMAKVLRERGHFACNTSFRNWQDHSLEGIKLGSEYEDMHLYEYFDKTIFLQKKGVHFFGKDIWRDIRHPELRAKCIKLAEELGL